MTLWLLSSLFTPVNFGHQRVNCAQCVLTQLEN